MSESNNKEKRRSTPLGSALLRRAQERGAKANDKKIMRERKKRLAKALALLIAR